VNRLGGDAENEIICGGDDEREEVSLSRRWKRAQAEVWVAKESVFSKVCPHLHLKGIFDKEERRRNNLGKKERLQPIYAFFFFYMAFPHCGQKSSKGVSRGTTR